MDKLIEKLVKEETPLTCQVEIDEFTLASEKAFDCRFDGISKFYPWQLPSKIPSSFGVGVIVGSSGSGKTTLLKNFGVESNPIWLPEKPIISHFNSPDEAINKLGAVGLNSIPVWYKPYNVLSNGEKFRADLSRKLCSNAVIDEFTSVVDRNVAKAASVSLSKYIKNNDISNVVLSTCHHDIIDWIEPDWVIDTDAGEFYSGFFLSDQKLKLTFTGRAMISGPCLGSITI